MGGVVFVAGSCVSTFSRRIQTTCLSSAESKCHGIMESAHETISASLMLQTFLRGLPPRLPDGCLSQVVGDIPFTVFTDRCISQMSRLLRKMRHLELRVLHIQELIEIGGMICKYISGRENLSDVLAKSSNKNYVNEFLKAVGLFALEALKRSFTGRSLAQEGVEHQQKTLR